MKDYRPYFRKVSYHPIETYIGFAFYHISF